MLGIPRSHTKIPIEYYVLSRPRGEGKLLGFLGPQPIYETVIDQSNKRYSYAGVASRDAKGAVHVDALRPGEWIVGAALIYVSEDTADPPKQHSS